MFTRLGRIAVRRRRAVLACSVLVLAVAGVLGSGVFGHLSGGGFDDPSSDSSRAERILESRFHTGSPNYVLLVDARGGDARAADGAGTPAVDAADVAAAAGRIEAMLRHDHAVAEVVSYWSFGRVAPLRSTDGTSALILARLGGDEDAQQDAAARLDADLLGRHGAVSVGSGARAPVFHAVSTRIEHDLSGAESIAVPITLVLLVLVFGGLVAAGLPLVVGVVSVIGTFFTLWLISLATDVSVFSINLVTAMGLGLAIDYSLFVVSRFREELRAGRSVEAAVVRTVETAGRTIAVSALTVAVSLSALLVFPLYFLRSFAYAGVGVTLVAMISSVVTLPALLAVLGHRVDSLRLWRRRDPTPVGQGFWHRLATGVMKRPVVVSLAAVAVLLFLGAPFRHVSFGVPDERVLPADAPARVTTQRIRTEFSSNESAAMPVVATSAAAADASDAAIDRYATALSQVHGVERVDAPTGRFIDGRKVLPADQSLDGFRAQDGSEAIRLSVVPGVVPISAAGERLVDDLRAVPSSVGPTMVGGQAAALVDSKAAIGDRLPWAAGIIAGATFVLLFLMFGSLLVPLKAIVLNILSLSATFGAMVWIFQEGHGAGWLGFTATGLTDTTTPILMFCIAFGLSMDYEVFLLSRIKEEHDRTGDNASSVAVGLEHTGRIVTAAAALLAVTFLAFATSGISFIKLFGLGLTLAVLMDATLIRATLVPAFMKLAGEANWWAPRPLRWLHDRIGFSESEPGDRPHATGVREPAAGSVDQQEFVRSHGDHRDIVSVGD
jgi:RND superfamily putative drug exporter